MMPRNWTKWQPSRVERVRLTSEQFFSRGATARCPGEGNSAARRSPALPRQAPGHKNCKATRPSGMFHQTNFRLADDSGVGRSRKRYAVTRVLPRRLLYQQRLPPGAIGEFGGQTGISRQLS